MKNGSIEVVVVARKSCKRCYGRGIVGRNALTGQVVVCRCARKVAPGKSGVTV